jgi:hypothetical protein
MRGLHDRKPPGTVDDIAQLLFDHLHNTVVPKDYAVIKNGSYEFWTATEEIWRHHQLHLEQRDQLAQAQADQKDRSVESEVDYEPDQV